MSHTSPTKGQLPRRRVLVLPLLAALCAALVPTLSLPSAALAQKGQSAKTGTVTGSVVDATDRAPLAGVTVSGGGKTARTDGAGRYTLNSVRAGGVTVTASFAPDYQSASASVTVERGKTATADFSLARTWGGVSGRVVDAATGAGLSGATVRLSDGGSSPLSATADGSGAFSFPKAPAGSKTLTASAAGYVDGSQSVTVAAGTTVTDVRVALQKADTGGGGGDGGSGGDPDDGGTPDASATILWNGTRSYLYGVNYAWWNYGTDFGTGAWNKFTDWNSISGHFAGLRSQGARVVRWWVFADGRYAPDFNADGTVAGLDGAFLADVDRALNIAAANDLYLMPTLIDSSMWSGASWSGAVQMGGHADLLTNAATQQSYLDRALRPLLEYVAAHPNGKRILAYDIVNEPESNLAYFWGGANLPAESAKTFVRRCAEYIHAYGGGAYATVGSAMPNYVGTWKGLGLDFYQFHYYPWMDTWVAGQAPGSGLPEYASLGLDKPCIVGEFPTNTGSYGLNDTAVHSGRWYLDQIKARGYAGALGWSTFVSDSASNWPSFQPLFTAWGQENASLLGPR
ncbi:MAG TPA: carboxypeptidase regulatory-like domain-containing protein [Armatimonadaceae bacterium]|nr:carboxypeptidase regulatory-like domain-containing protein [Armatimonadaceae bacterium]